MKDDTPRAYPLIRPRGRRRYAVAKSLDEWQQHKGRVAVAWAAGDHLTLVERRPDGAFTGQLMWEFPGSSHSMQPEMAEWLFHAFEHYAADEPRFEQKTPSYTYAAEALEQSLHVLTGEDDEIPLEKHTRFLQPSEQDRKKTVKALARIRGTDEWSEARSAMSPAEKRRYGISSTVGTLAASITLVTTHDVPTSAVAGAITGVAAHLMTEMMQDIRRDTSPPKH